jgi:hypothetical protein
MRHTTSRHWQGLIVSAMLSIASCLAYAAPPDTLKFCSGGVGGFYEGLATSIGGKITNEVGNTLKVMTTGGSVDNAKKLKAGECDIAIIQADAVITQPMPASFKAINAHEEVVYWLYPKGGEVDDFGDMEDDKVMKKYAFATVKGSGASVTLNNWIKTDKDYAGAVPVEFKDWYSAAEAVAQGFTMDSGVRVDIAGMLYIGRLGMLPADITSDFGNQLMVGGVDDSSFENAKDANGNPLYTHCAIPKGKTSGLEGPGTFSDVKTYCLRAQVVFNNAYLTGLDEAETTAVRRAVDKGINSTVKVVR